MRRSGVIAWKSNGSLLWTTPLALMVAVPGLIMIALAVMVSYGRTGHPVDVILGVIGASAVIVAVSGRIESAIYTRDRDLAFPSGRVDSVDQVKRVSVRRANGAMYYATTAIVPLFPIVIVWTSLDPADYGPPDAPVELGLLLVGVGAVAWLVMAGLTARFVVTPTEFRIDTLLRTVSVARHLVGTFEAAHTEIRLTCNDDAGRIYFRVDQPLLDWFQQGGKYRHNRRTQLRTWQKILTALSAVLADPRSTGGITRRWRPVFVTAVSLIAAVMIAGAVTVAANVGSLPNGS